MYCTNCGKEVQQDAAFCSSCGTKIGDYETTELNQDRYVQANDQGRIYVILGWVFFGISILFIPIIFGAGAFVMGFLTYRVRSQTHGVILMVFSVAGAILGMLLGAAFVEGY